MYIKSCTFLFELKYWTPSSIAPHAPTHNRMNNKSLPKVSTFVSVVGIFIIQFKIQIQKSK